MTCPPDPRTPRDRALEALRNWTAPEGESKRDSLLRFLGIVSEGEVAFVLNARILEAIRAAFRLADHAVAHRARTSDWSARVRANVGPITPDLLAEALAIDADDEDAVAAYLRDTE